MREISPAEAESRYSIRTAHHEDGPGGERRFRLGHTDGTRYIRTETPASPRGVWQEAHLHRSVRETYIVQDGAMAFADEHLGRLRIRLLRAGDMVTTDPGVAHNVFIPSSGAVLHTVKHGAGRGEDKEPAQVLDAACRRLADEAAVFLHAAQAAAPAPAASLGEEYRHYDSLIWQTPGWSTAVFLGTAAVLGQSSQENLGKLLAPFTPGSLVSGFLLVVFLVLLGLTHALHRFRVHQRPLKPYRPTRWWASASSYLNLYSTGLAFLVLYLALGTLPVSSGLAAGASMVGCLVLAGHREYALRRPPLDA